MAADLNSLQATEASVTIITTASLTADIPAIRSYRNTRGSQVLIEIQLGSNIITCHQQLEDTSI
jgi:hypothetical protein